MDQEAPNTPYRETLPNEGRIPANPQKAGAKPILRSDDMRYGVEFSWSVWIYLNDYQFYILLY